MTSLHEGDTPTWHASWAYLVEAYRPLMERYVRRILARSGRHASVDDEASDLVQGFLAACVEKSWFAPARPDRGRFRAFLQTLLRRYVYSHLRHVSARKRSPGPARHVSLEMDDVASSRGEEETALQEFDRGWVKVAVDRALDRLTEENARYAAIVQDLIATEGAGSPDATTRLGVSPKQLPVVKHRARKRFSRLFVAELRSTVSDERDFAEEWAALAKFLP